MFNNAIDLSLMLLEVRVFSVLKPCWQIFIQQSGSANLID
jgi:hypothetical protein